jgi:putative transposase
MVVTEKLVFLYNNRLKSDMKQDILEPGVVYHIYNRGNNRENLFIEQKNYSYFLNKTRFHLAPICDIYAYCLMPNHFHFIVRIKESNITDGNLQKELYQPFSNLFNSYTKSINLSYGRTGSLFQEHFHRERITKDDYFRNAFIYVHTNPVHHKFVSHFLEYNWSSIQDYKNQASTIVNMEFPLQAFDGIENMLLEHNRKNTMIQKLLDFEE